MNRIFYDYHFIFIKMFNVTVFCDHSSALLKAGTETSRLFLGRHFENVCRHT